MTFWAKIQRFGGFHSALQKHGQPRFLLKKINFSVEMSEENWHFSWKNDVFAGSYPSFAVFALGSAPL
jgi:hypothetical protein